MAIIGASNSLGGLSGSNAVARLLVVISGQSSGLEAAVAKSEGTLSGLSKNASSIGKTLTRSLSLPLLALGGLAIKTASDFETSFARVIGISTILDKRFNDLGLTSGTLRQTLLDMANDPSIVATPKELADALYFAGSAGLKASQALDVVRSAAQGASIGLGSAEDIAKVLIFSLTNFSDEGVTATKAMDIFTAAVQEGTAAPNELAIALGRLLPVAKAAGVSLQTTVAAVASLTNLGVPTRVATTSLRALFSELLAPTKAASARLNELGISADRLRGTLAHGGLVEAMGLLLNATHGNQDALHDIIPQIRGFTAFLGLTDQQMRRYISAQDAVIHSTGKFQTALKVIEATPGFKFQKALQSLNIAAVNLGEQLLPVFEKIAEVITGVAKAFSNLPKPVQTAAAAFIVLGAAIGPIFQLYGALTATTEKAYGLGVAGTRLAPTWKAVGVGFVTAGIAATVAIGGFEALTRGSTSLVTVATTLVGTFIAVELALKGLQAAALSGKLGAGVFSEALVGLGGQAYLVAAGIGLVVTAVALFIGSSHRAEVAAAELQKELVDGAKSASTFRDTLNTVKDTAIRNELTAIAEKLHVLDQPTGRALTSIVSSGGDVVDTLKSVQTAASGATNVLNQGARTAVLNTIDTFQKLVKSGVSVGDALVQAGIDSESFRKNIVALAGPGSLLGAGGTDPFLNLANSVGVSVAAFKAAVASNTTYQQSQKDNIIAATANQQDTEALAKKLGVSTGFVSQKLTEVGDSATGMTGAALTAFKSYITGGKDISAATAEMQANIAAAAADINKSLTDAFDPFKKLPDTSKTSFDKLQKQFTGLTRIAETETANIRSLVARGIPGDLLTKSLAAGPGAIASLAGLTDRQFKVLITAYEVGLGTIDSKILDENTHQQQKGQDMVAGFAQAMLSQSELPRAASEAIIHKVADAFARGDLKSSALVMVQQFTLGLAHVKGLSAKEATGAVNAFADQLIHGDVLNQRGKLMVDKVVAGIVAETGISRAAALSLVESVTGQIDKGQAKAQVSGVQLIGAAIHGMAQGAGGTDKIGASLARQFAQGITAQTNYVQTAAAGVALAAKAAMLRASHASPELFTYHLGTDLVNELGRGMADASRYLSATKPKVQLSGGFTAPTSGAHTDKLSVALDVKLDRQKAGRELAYSANMGY